MTTTKTITERQTGTRTIACTDWPVRDLVQRDQRPGKRPTWVVLRGLCNGVPDRAESYATRREALEAFGEP